MRKLLVSVLLLVGLASIPSCAPLQRATDAATTPSDQLGGKTPIRVIVEGGGQIATGNPVAGGISIAEAIGVILSAVATGAAAGHVTGGSKAQKVATDVATAVVNGQPPPAKA